MSHRSAHRRSTCMPITYALARTLTKAMFHTCTHRHLTHCMKWRRAIEGWRGRSTRKDHGRWLCQNWLTLLSRRGSASGKDCWPRFSRFVVWGSCDCFSCMFVCVCNNPPTHTNPPPHPPPTHNMGTDANICEGARAHTHAHTRPFVHRHVVVFTFGNGSVSFAGNVRAAGAHGGSGGHISPISPPCLPQTHPKPSSRSTGVAAPIFGACQVHISPGGGSTEPPATHKPPKSLGCQPNPVMCESSCIITPGGYRILFDGRA